MARHLTLTVLFTSLVLIYAKHCKIKCGVHESNDLCGKSCEPSCELRDFSAVSCIACSKMTEGCRCNQGYLRDEKTGFCVLPEDCTVCDTGESHIACGRTCEGNCTHPYRPETCQLIRCSKQQCGCDLNEGYVRDTESSRCIAINNCPAC